MCFCYLCNVQGLSADVMGDVENLSLSQCHKNQSNRSSRAARRNQKLSSSNENLVPINFEKEIEEGEENRSGLQGEMDDPDFYRAQRERKSVKSGVSLEASFTIITLRKDKGNICRRKARFQSH